MTIAAPMARAQAIDSVLGDPGMKLGDKIKAVSSYIQGYGIKTKRTEKSLSKLERYINKIEDLEAKETLSPAEKRRLQWFKSAATKETATAMSDLYKKKSDKDRITSEFVSQLPDEFRGIPLAEIDTR